MARIDVWKNPGLREVWLEEARIERLVGRVIGESSNCIDVGSHLGMVLSLFMKHAPGGRHMAFEPNPRQAGWLDRKFPEVDVRRQALGETRGEATFYLDGECSGYSGLQLMREPGPHLRELTVPVDRLDDLVGPEHRVDFLKIVVEGAELSVLRGAVEILRRDRPFLLFECTPAALALFGDTPAKLFEFLTVDHGYDVFLIKHVLDGGGPLGRAAFEEALRYPFQGFKFAATAAVKA